MPGHVAGDAAGTDEEEEEEEAEKKKKNDWTCSSGSHWQEGL